MESRSGAHLHFIQAIRSGGVEKVQNVDYCGRSVLVFKALKDIYDSEDVKRCPNLSTHQLEDRFEDMAMISDGVRVGTSHERKSKKREIDSENFNQNSRKDDEESDSDDINFGKTTLKQLKKRSKEKKRKVMHFHSVTVKQEYVDCQPEEDETDLKETISSWKSKVSKKTKGIKRSPHKCALIPSPVKSEPISVTECFEQVHIISEVCDSSVVIETPVADENGLQSGSRSSLLEENESCALNEVSYDHLEDIGDDVIMEHPKIYFPQLANAPYSEDEESSIWSSIPGEVFPEAALPFRERSSDYLTNNSNKITGDEVLSNLCELNDYNCQKTPLYLEYVSLTPPMENSSSSWVSSNSSNHEIVLVCEDDLYSSQGEPVSSVSTDVETEYIHSSAVVLLEASAAIEGEQFRSSPLDDEENDSPDRNQHCDPVCDNSVLEMENHSFMGPCRPPERLLSTRKVISPTSQEMLCQAMKGVEMIEDVDFYNPKEKLHFKDATENEPFTKEQGAENTNVETHLPRLGAVTRSKVTMGSKRTPIKKNSPPKRNQKSPNLSRSLPNFSTSTRSLHKISESAIAFSQRQMCDFESLATKLMHELNSMKEIVEEKLHCETSSPEILKYDADKLIPAIRSAKKTEETTRKWLSMMTRDCNRFCTILKLNEKDESASPNKTHKERRKISFADEAGGVLCHVKVFDDDMASLNSQR